MFYPLNRSLCIENKLNFDPLHPGVERSSIYATSGTLANGQVSCPNMAIWKLTHILGTVARKAKISSISKESICATSLKVHNRFIPKCYAYS